MKKNFIHRMSVSDILSGGADDIARKALEIWNSSNGILNEDLYPLHKKFVHFSANDSAPENPSLILSGKEALATMLLGDDWADRPTRALGALDDEYRDLVGLGYRLASLEHKPVFDYVSTALHCEGVGDVQLRYQRLILPFQTLHGATFLFCYSQDAGSSQLTVDPEKDAEPLLRPKLQSTNHEDSLPPVVYPR